LHAEGRDQRLLDVWLSKRVWSLFIKPMASSCSVCFPRAASVEHGSLLFGRRLSSPTILEEHHDRRVPENTGVVSPPRRFPTERMFTDSMRNRLTGLEARAGHFFTSPEHAVATTQINDALANIRTVRMQLAAHASFVAYARHRLSAEPAPPSRLLPRASLATMVPARIMDTARRQASAPNTVAQLGTKRARVDCEVLETQPSPKRQRRAETPSGPDKPSVEFPVIIEISSETESEDSDDDWRMSVDELADDLLTDERNVVGLSKEVLREAAQHNDRNYFETRMIIEQAEEEMRRRRRRRREAARRGQ